MTSTNNTTENGFWEREKQVCEGSRSFSSIDPDAPGVLNAADYLPQFVARRFGEVVPILADSCRLKVRFHPSQGNLSYKYSVSWFEDGPVHEEIKQLKLKKSNKEKPKIVATKKGKSGKHCCQGDAANLPVLQLVKKKNSQEVSVEF
uniref:Uncharacterized protein n=1 Tax=Panagrolaimus sp. JU765 TaxID=591449 RepID=A0AC34Q159_9BILA